MLIRIPKPWEVPGLRPTDESVYMNRRSAIKTIGLGAAALIAGCDMQGPKALKGLIGNVKAEASYKPSELLNGKYKLDRAITNERKATTFNNFYEFSSRKNNVYKKVDRFVISPWKVDIGGLVENPMTLDVDDIIKKMPIEERLYRFRCVEAWAMAVPWMGFQFSELVKMVRPKPEAKYVRLVTFYRPEQAPRQKSSRSPWPYEEGLTIEEAMNELTFIATGMYGKPLKKQNGAPIRLVVPWKYGYKSIKSIVKIVFTQKQPSTFWNTLAPNEYGFESNVNPNMPHPRWSQRTERLIDTGETVDTLLYNGYGDFLTSLY